MAANLVIVESPAKAKTIEKFLGSDFLVKSSFGHIRDLPKKGIGVDLNGTFEPTYEVSEDKHKVVSELKKLAKGATTVWLASDEDREGEAIAWHLSQVLNLDAKTTNRIVFHEITKNAILNAVKTPRTIDINLVNAQQARRVLDRLVGFELSPVLWRKVKPSLSAGRVQSVAVRLIVEREREIIAFVAEGFFKVTAVFEFTASQGKKYEIKAELNHRFKKESDAADFLNICADAAYEVISVDVKPTKRSSAAPFTTSTLQQEASRKLGFSVSQTMSTAQRLYEAGLITYMRTDSVNLSKDAVGAICGVVEGRYGKQYLSVRTYKNKNKSAQEAHEAIRPSYIENDTVDGSSAERRLYELIWKRTVASQMADARLERTVIDISVSGSERRFVSKGEVVIFDGFLKLYSESTDSDDSQEELEGLMPPLNSGDVLSRLSVEATERYTQRPARYSEAALVKQLEELGIGRPSTYAPTITTIINRGYVVKEDREGVRREYIRLVLSGKNVEKITSSEITGAEKSKLFPTDIGIIVNDFLESHFPSILDYNFTAKVEKEFDDIAEGQLVWQEMLKDFYTPFHATVESATKEEGGYAATQSLRELGVDPKSGKTVYVRMGRFGPVAQLGQSDGDLKPQYSSLQAGQLIETITLDQAISLFALPRVVGEYEENEVSVAVGRFGPYIKHAGIFVSLEKSDSPYTVDLNRTIELIEAKRKKERERVIKLFPQDDKMQVLNGRYGAYIAFDGANYKLPKGVEPAILTFEECVEIVEKQKLEDPKPRRAPRGGFKKAVAKKAPAKRVAAKKK